MMQELSFHVTAGMPQLGIHGLAEDWAVTAAGEGAWACLAASLGRRPSDWVDSAGQRMYAAFVALDVVQDLAVPVVEDDLVTATTRLLAIRKPHGLCETLFQVDGQTRMQVRMLTTFVRRDTAGSNKKLSKVRDVWTADDLAPAMVDDWLQRHHETKAHVVATTPVLTHEANRLADFNAADLFYFRNFIRLAMAAEWRANRGGAPRMTAHRAAWYYGNVDDGDQIHAAVGGPPEARATELTDDGGRRLFLSIGQTAPVDIAIR